MNNIKFFNNCYNMIALSTCVLQDPENKDWMYGTRKQIPINDRLTAVTKYENLCSDYISAYDYEIHYFSVDFLRDGKLIDSFSYERKIDEKRFGSLANPDLSIEQKLNSINSLKPGLRSQIKTITMSTELTPEEMEAVESVTKELTEQVVAQMPVPGKGK